MKRSRRASIRAAFLLAAGFIALRVVYRMVFGGADGSGILLVDLPSIQLGGPFAHITLFGPITSGGIAAAAQSALPFAALVRVIGLIAAVVDLPALLARGANRGPVRAVSRALVVAWSTFPALLDSVRRVRVARDLRGERSVASLVVPVLEHTVERAITLGASMEVRGFAAQRRVAPTCEHPAVFRDVSLGYDDDWVLVGINLEIAPSTVTLVTGQTGAGKSTFLHALSGLFQHVSGGVQAGELEVAGVDREAVPPRETAGFVGVVSQSPRLSFVAATVEEELGFALTVRGVATPIVQARVREVADRLGIRPLLERTVTALSAGEACLVAIGAALVEHPVLLVVDEPLADLDDAARARIIGILAQLASEAGVAVVVAEHVAGDWGDIPNTWLEIRDGTVLAVERPRVATAPPSRRAVPVSTTPPVAEVHDLSVSYGDRQAVAGVSLRVSAGELVALRGPNGAGKSSVLHAMARPSSPLTVLVDGADVQGLNRRERRHSVALVPEAFDDLLFATSVDRECRRADARGHQTHTAETFARLLSITSPAELGAILDRHPRDLSAGQRLCLVLAIQLAAEPRVLLVDEPTRGLDAAARALVGGALIAAARSGAAVVFATHDRDFAMRFADREIAMSAGRLDAPIGVSP